MTFRNEHAQSSSVASIDAPVIHGNAVIEVYVKGAAKKTVGQPIPDELDGVPVRVIETGEIRAF